MATAGVPATDIDTKIQSNDVELVEDASSTPDKSSRIPAYVRNLTPEDRERTENSLRRKVDTRLLPMVVLIYIMNYLDRNNIAAAKLAGLEKDLKMTGEQFQTSVSILFVGYLLMQGNSTSLATRKLVTDLDINSTIQSSFEQARKTIAVSARMYGSLGTYFGSHSCMPNVRWLARL